MPQSMIRWSVNIMALFSLCIAFFLLTTKNVAGWSISSMELQSFKTIFLSIALEALPFILIGVVVSSLIQVFIPDRWIRRLVPRSPVAGVIVGALLGILFPLCECGMIPVVRRLVIKGMPLYIGIVYILAGPIINPVVYGSTAMAFRQMPDLIWLRMGLAFMVAVSMGLIIHRWVKTNPLRSESDPKHEGEHEHHHDHQHDHPIDHNHQNHGEPKRLAHRLTTTLSHISDEFFDMGKYLLLGCMITAAFQVFVPRDWLLAWADGASSHLFMAGFAYLLSICSTSDAFIASSFVGTFTTGSLLTFMVFGPMLDLKNTLVLLSVFRAKFVALLSLGVLILVLAGSMLAEYLFL